MSSDRAPPERPEPRPESEETPVAERHEPLSHICTEPGDRIAGESSVGMMVVEAELACLEGKELPNPAKPISESVGEQLLERLAKHDEDLVPAWTRPWEGDDE